MVPTAAFHALADPTRIEIVLTLSAGPATVSQLARPHEMSLRAVLKHIRVLEDAALIATSKQGRTRSCALLPEALAETAAWLTQVEQRWHRRIDRIEQIVERTTP